jgi:hypothetical protein
MTLKFYSWTPSLLQGSTSLAVSSVELRNPGSTFKAQNSTFRTQNSDNVKTLNPFGKLRSFAAKQIFKE